MCAVHGPSASISPKGSIIVSPSQKASTVPIDESSLRHEPEMIDLARPRVPALREDPHELLGARIPRPCGDAPRDADALLDDLLVAELGEALGRAQDSLERAATPRAEQSREVRLARLRVGDFPEAAELAQPPLDVAGRHHAR